MRRSAGSGRSRGRPRKRKGGEVTGGAEPSLACPFSAGATPGPVWSAGVAARPQAPPAARPPPRGGGAGQLGRPRAVPRAPGRAGGRAEPFACGSGSYVEWPGCGGTSWAQNCRSWAPYFCFVWEMPSGKEALLGSAGSAETVLPTNGERNGFRGSARRWRSLWVVF